MRFAISHTILLCRCWQKVEIGICFFSFLCISAASSAAAVDVGEKQDIIMDFVALKYAGGNRPGQDK